MKKTLLASCLLIMLLFLNYRWYQIPVQTSMINNNAPTSHKFSNEDDLAFRTSDLLNSDLVHTYTRPLFNEDRRKYSAPKKVKKSITQPKTTTVEKIEVVEKIAPPKLSLLGISIVRGKSAALIVDKESNVTAWMDLNTVVQNWKIASIKTDRIILLNAEQSMEVPLYTVLQKQSEIVQ